jgi:hypothetical protein
VLQKGLGSRPCEGLSTSMIENEGSAGEVELPPVRGAGYEPSAASGEPTGVALFRYVAVTPCLSRGLNPLIGPQCSAVLQDSAFV